jgi:hypothetical protein
MRLAVPRAALALSALLSISPALAGRLPGIGIEVFNNSGAEAAVTAVFNDGSTATRPIPPGRSESFGSGLTWHVYALGRRSELQHPGDEFAVRTWLGATRFRFQIEPSGCIFALGAAQAPPVREFAVQPRGDPIGCREEPPAEQRGR